MELVGNFVTTGATSLKAAIKAWAKKALLNFQERQQRRADWCILQNMSDKDLKDIGITRGEISDVLNRK
mgnify:CR=1 FL=1|jgi:uncharacterized protein YjiS (DUF1127 family)|tara:strand:+ start:2062 stop:2268 length:207 start_codon:yes stop_codon:yes gene_type:complete